MFNPWYLNVDWRFGTVPLITSLIDPHNCCTLMVVVCVAGLAIWSATGRHRAVAISLSLLILPYLPASNLFFPVGFVVAERVLYLPSMGFCMLVGFGAWHLIQTTTANKNKIAKNVIICFVLYVLVIQSVKTITRNPEWKSHIPLFKSGIRLNPHNGLLLSNLGKELKQVGDWELTESVLWKAVEVSPTHSGGHSNLGKILFHSQRYTEAIPVSNYIGATL